jgi:molybdopterin-guanine dinucleotide biosynthesis protein A
MEPQWPRHPLVGIVEALALADGRPVLVCPADLPFLTPALIAKLAAMPVGTAPAVIVSCAGETQPLLGCYRHVAASLLAPVAKRGEAPVRQAVEAIGPRLLEIDNPDELFNVNSPEDLLLAAGILDRAAGARTTGRPSQM